MPSVDLRIAAAGGAAIGIGAFLVGQRFGRRKQHVVSASKSIPLAAPSEASGIDLWTVMPWARTETPPPADNITAMTESDANVRLESDLLGELKVPHGAYWGIQTLRALSNYQISGIPVSHFPDFVIALATVKKAAAQANVRLGTLDKRIGDAICQACSEIITGRGSGQHLPNNMDALDLRREFIVDMIQGGAGTSTNMNTNEVVANRALELLGFKKGAYIHCHPNDHVNKSQSTNDSYPTACKLAIILKQRALSTEMRLLVKALHRRAKAFRSVLKMGRTQLQDAVPMTLGQEIASWANSIETEIDVVEQRGKQLLCVNMGGTAIGTGICANSSFGQECVKSLREISGLDFHLADDLIEASSCVDGMLSMSGTLRRVALKISKICSDLRLLSSGPRCGLGEIKLPAMAPGSSIMPGKVNPIIPEMVNQVAFCVCGNDVRVMMAAEHGQLQLNVFEPIMVFSIFQSIDYLTRALHALRTRCIDGILANEKHCSAMVHNSIGIVTALLPEIGYKNCSYAAKMALRENTAVTDVVLREGYLSNERLQEIMQPDMMVGSAFCNEAEISIENEVKSNVASKRSSVAVNIDLQSGSEYGTYVRSDSLSDLHES